MIAAFLYAQLEEVKTITLTRLSLWNYYHKLLEPLEQASKLRRPTIPAHCQHNAHMYYILVENLDTRSAMIEYLKQQGINSVFHYVPLHSSPAGLQFGKVHGSMENTNHVSDRLLRLPMFYQLEFPQIKAIVDTIEGFYSTKWS